MISHWVISGLLLWVWVIAVSTWRQAQRTQRQLDQDMARLSQRVAELERQAAARTAQQPTAPFAQSLAESLSESLSEQSDGSGRLASQSVAPQADAVDSPSVDIQAAKIQTSESPTFEQSAPSTPASTPQTSASQTPQPAPQSPPPIVWPAPFSTPPVSAATPTRAFKPAVLEPDEQSVAVVTSLWSTALGWLRSGNTIVRIGVLVLLVGVVLLLRLASHYFHAPIELRLSVVALGGVALAATGLYLRHTRRGYALSLQGAGLAVLYMTLFAAYRLYAVLPSTLTFTLLAVLAGLTALLAVRQDALPLALLAFGGAFAAPLLTSHDAGHVVALFGYYLVINVALAAVAHYRTWRMLNLLGVLFSFGVAGVWGFTRFDAALRWPLEALLIAHVALYVFIAVRYSQQLLWATGTTATDTTAIDMPSDYADTRSQQAVQPKMALVDGGLLFGVPIMAFSLQAGLLHGMPYALALSSAVLSALYLLLGRYLLRQGQGLRLLTEGTLALGLGFLALVLPLALNAQWTSVGWAVQGAGLVWVGQRQARGWSVVFGLVLQAISVCMVLWLWWLPLWSGHQQTAGWSMALWVLMLSVWLSAACVRQDHRAGRRLGAVVLVLLAQGLSIWALHTLHAHVSTWVAMWAEQSGLVYLTVDFLGVAAVSCVLLQRLHWPALAGVLRGLLPLTGLLFLGVLTQTNHTSSDIIFTFIMSVLGALVIGVGAWMLAVVTQHGVRTRLDQALWLLGSVVLLTQWLDHIWPALQPLTPALVPVLTLLSLQHQDRQWTWFNRSQVRHDTARWILAFLGVWLLVVNGQASGQWAGLPYVPLLNPLDILLGLVMWCAYVDMQQRDGGMTDRHITQRMLMMIGLAGFFSLTGLVLRTLHQWAYTPLWTGGAWQSDTVQTSLTIIWTLLALLLTGLASHHGRVVQRRALWWAGIALLGVVVAKLLLVDLSNVGAIARVISFIGAGLMMLLIGYIAPLPPADALAEPAPDESTPDQNAPDQSTPDQDHD